MVQLEVLSGKRAGAVAVARRFPFVVGRDGSSDLRLEDGGVWDRHLELDLQMPDGFALKVLSQARAAVNDQPVQQAVILRNGDVIGIGAVKIRFWLGETRQLGLQMREFLTWAALVMLCAGQIALIYRLLP
jgi:pSer/pThr/pTyr-binding forkhead associated (FHA) protein